MFNVLVDASKSTPVLYKQILSASQRKPKESNWLSQELRLTIKHGKTPQLRKAAAGILAGVYREMQRLYETSSDSSHLDIPLNRTADEFVPVFLEALSDKDPEIRGAAINSLAAYHKHPNWMGPITKKMTQTVLTLDETESNLGAAFGTLFVFDIDALSYTVPALRRLVWHQANSISTYACILSGWLGKYATPLIPTLIDKALKSANDNELRENPLSVDAANALRRIDRDGNKIKDLIADPQQQRRFLALLVDLGVGGRRLSISLRDHWHIDCESAPDDYLKSAVVSEHHLGSDLSNPPRLIVRFEDEGEDTITLDGRTFCNIDVEGVILIDILNKALIRAEETKNPKESWVSLQQINNEFTVNYKCDFKFERVDRIITILPPRFRKLVERKPGPGGGSRLILPPLA